MGVITSHHQFSKKCANFYKISIFWNCKIIFLITLSLVLLKIKDLIFYCSANSGQGYDQEEDPDFQTAEEGDDEESSSESSDEEEECEIDETEDAVAAKVTSLQTRATKVSEVEDLTEMVEDMAIPDEEGDKNAEIENNDEEEDEDDVVEMSFQQQLE